MLFNQGQDAHEKGDLQTALKFYDEAIKLAPEFPEAEYQRGNALQSLGKIAEAEKAFRRALELREDWTLPMTSLGALLVDKNNFAEAEKVLTKAIELDAQNFPAYSALTELRLKSKAGTKTIKELLAKLQTLTSTTKPTASMWISRAALENALDDKIAAKTSLNRALAIEPKNKSALMKRADIALAEDDTTAAIEILKILSEILPNSTDAKLLQAKIFAVTGKAVEAIKILDSITNPTSEVRILRDKIAAFSSANVADLEKQLEKDGKDAVILGRLCALLRKENPNKALNYCRRASEAEPNNINHAVGFGAALVQAKRSDDAISVFRKLLQIVPDNFAAHANLATALFELKRFEEAKLEYLWLAKKQPDLAITYFFLAISHDNLGQYKDAMANYQQFLKLADASQNKLEIEKVELRLPSLQRQIKSKK
ncbi:MAG: tetratricopeptide repeat protein [Acidobacteriota bacterium]|nr:tetratricopeptide repeat protein [Acidobacteriota bacterium]